MDDYHPITTRIRTLLDEAGVTYETFEHEAVRTSLEASQVRGGYGLHQGAKSIIVKAKTPEGKRFLMFVVPGNKRFHEGFVKRALGFRDIRFASEEEVKTITGGVLPGGVPPFGVLFDLPVYADETLFDNERIIFNAGDRRFSIALRAEDYRNLVQPTIAPFAALAEYKNTA
jgi:prolyl-tRNA editing enzyme YbaK/EbsC (Cys-tRNA(Pro) deacylase)